MSSLLVGVAVDCADPLTLAQFWADVLGRQVAEDSTPGHAVLLADRTDTGSPLVVFNVVPEPKTVKNRLHLDVTTADLQAVVDHGATVLREQDDETGWTVLADPQGNEFCAFLA